MSIKETVLEKGESVEWTLEMDTTLSACPADLQAHGSLIVGPYIIVEDDINGDYFKKTIKNNVEFPVRIKLNKRTV